MVWLLMNTTDAISWAPSEKNGFLVWLKAVRGGKEGRGEKVHRPWAGLRVSAGMGLLAYQHY
jgi:hypothetical protein